MNTKLRMGMIGGGPDAFIGAVHRIAARMDGHIDLVSGCFSSDELKTQQTGNELALNPNRLYATFQEMIEKESLLGDSERIDFISIVTPNHLHFEPAKMAMLKGFDIVLDKPLCLNISEAKELLEIQQQTKKILCLTHTYTGYPMLKQAKQMVAKGDIGDLKKIYVEYPQSWLSTALENTNNKQAAWRTDPKRSGAGGCIGDIGTHAFNLAEYVSGKKVIALCAHLEHVVKGRALDDDAMMLLKFEDGVTGILTATQIAAGEENNIRIKIYGDKGGLEWQQEDNNTLQVKMLNRPKQIFRTSNIYLSESAQFNVRVPSGHPEGYLEAFANLYKNFALTIKARKFNLKIPAEAQDFPTIQDGLRGMAFIDNVIKSHHSSKKWTSFDV